MSLFLCAFDREQAIIVTDSLATTTDGEPYLFVTKATPVPQMRTVMVCTGIAALGDLWAAKLRNGVLSLDVEMLDRHTPDVLRDLWSQLRDEFGFADDVTTTVYHVGMTRDGGECRVYAYRSKADFTSERLPEKGFAIKPNPLDLDNLPEDFVEIAEYLRREQSTLPPAEQIHVGGELYITNVSAAGIAIAHLHTFDDFAEVWNEANRLAGVDVE